ncbi:MAG: hypothetical protein ACW99Q_19265, partial [Candidatus Kariarchaeaceae archaeon]
YCTKTSRILHRSREKIIVLGFLFPYWLIVIRVLFLNVQFFSCGISLVMLLYDCQMIIITYFEVLYNGWY